MTKKWTFFSLALDFLAHVVDNRRRCKFRVALLCGMAVQSRSTERRTLIGWFQACVHIFLIKYFSAHCMGQKSAGNLFMVQNTQEIKRTMINGHLRQYWALVQRIYHSSSFPFIGDTTSFSDSFGVLLRTKHCLFSPNLCRTVTTTLQYTIFIGKLCTFRDLFHAK